MTTSTESGFAEINAGRLYWEAAGAGEPLVFVHGFTLDTRMWDDQWDVFAQRHRVYRYDCRGFGRSSLPDGPFSHQDDLRALMDSFNVEKFHLAGLSMGGSISIDYAVTRPGDLLSLILIDAGGGGLLSQASWKPHHDLAVSQGMRAAKDLWLERDLFIPANRDAGVKARLSQIVEDYSGWHWQLDDIANSGQAVPDPPAVERLDSVTVPALVIVGELDVPRMQDNAAVLATIPSSRLEVVADAGHMANMEKPEEVNRLMLEFLAGLTNG